MSVPKYRWLIRGGTCWLDDISSEDAEPCIRASIWPGCEWERKASPLEVACGIAPQIMRLMRDNDPSRPTIIVRRHDLFDRQKMQGLGVMEFVIHTDSATQIRENFWGGESLIFRTSPPSLWDLLRWDIIPSRIFSDLHSNSGGYNRRYGSSRGAWAPRYTGLDSLVEVRAEETARKTLRSFLSRKQYNRYLRDGFLPVKAKSGRVYLIGSGTRHAAVYENGKLVDNVCWMLPNDFSFTDQFLFRYVRLLHNEKEYNEKANHHPIDGVNPRSKVLGTPKKVDHRPLSEIVREIKQVIRTPLRDCAEHVRAFRELRKKAAEKSKVLLAHLPEGTVLRYDVAAGEESQNEAIVAEAERLEARLAAEAALSNTVPETVVEQTSEAGVLVTA